MPKKILMLMATESPGSYLNVAKVLGKNGFRIKIICLGHKKQTKTEELSNNITIQRLNKNGIFYSPFVSVLNPFLIIKLCIYSIHEKSDIYWGHGLTMLPILMILKIFRKTVIYDVSDDDVSNYSYVISNRFHLIHVANIAEHIFREFERFGIRKMDYVITSTDSLKKDRESYAKHIKSIYYCLDPSFNPHNIDEQMKIKFSGYDVIVYSGTISLKKAFIEILQAFEIIRTKNKKAFLLMVGGIDKSCELEVKNLLKEKESVFVTGWIPYENMPKYISLGKIGLALIKPANYSYKISVPNKVLEQMACGLPVIVSSGLPEVEKIINQTNCGVVVDISDPHQIAEAALNLLGDENTRVKMSKSGYNYIRMYHNIDNLEEELMEVFHAVIKGQC